jgi:hypothetical protein
VPTVTTGPATVGSTFTGEATTVVTTTAVEAEWNNCDRWDNKCAKELLDEAKYSLFQIFDYLFGTKVEIDNMSHKL